MRFEFVVCNSLESCCQRLEINTANIMSFVVIIPAANCSLLLNFLTEVGDMSGGIAQLWTLDRLSATYAGRIQRFGSRVTINNIVNSHKLKNPSY